MTTFWLLIKIFVVFHHAFSKGEDILRTSAMALVNEKGRIPCHTTVSELRDKPVLVLWYKNFIDTPIYSFDARETEFTQGRHWAFDRLMNKRAYFQLGNRPVHSEEILRQGHIPESFGAHLELYPVKSGDNGTYRCRVDFLHSPTRNTIVEFTVVVPPESISILNGTRDRIGVLIRSRSRAGSLDFRSPIFGTSNIKYSAHDPFKIMKSEARFSDFRSLETETFGYDSSKISNFGQLNSVLEKTEPAYFGSSETETLNFNNPKFGTFNFESLEGGVDENSKITSSKKYKYSNFGVAEIGPSIIGPYNDGEELVLYCRVSGGTPTPEIKWYINNRFYNTTQIRISKTLVQSVLVVDPLPREFLHAVLECRARNFDFRTELSVTVTLNMNFRPANVSVWTTENSLISGVSYKFFCETWGSDPPAKITWWKGGALQKSKRKISTKEENDRTVSVYTFEAKVEDNVKNLICRAENPHIATSAIEDSLKMDILYRPRLSLQLGLNLNPQDLDEGEDAYFECHVNANPRVATVIWMHNGVHIKENNYRGVLIGNQTLVFQKVDRSRVGNYTCSAENSQGFTTSNEIGLRIKYKPYCRKRPKILFGTAIGEAISVTCEVDADPGPVTFRWTFNNTSEHLPISSASVKSKNLLSTVHYRPKQKSEFGTLLCWAFNSVGEQQTPCAFSIIPARGPDPLKNCTIRNQTTSHIVVNCEPGFDGGLPQKFLIQVYELRTAKLLRNATSKLSKFIVKNLRSGTELKILVNAFNEKGTGPEFILETFTLRSAQKRTDSSYMFGFSRSTAGLVFGISSLIIILSGILFVLLWIKKFSKNTENVEHSSYKICDENCPGCSNCQNLGVLEKDGAKSESSIEGEEFDSSIVGWSVGVRSGENYNRDGANFNKLYSDIDPDLIPPKNN